MGIFDKSLSQEYIKNLVQLDAQKIFEVLKNTKEFFGLNGLRKKYAEEYLMYISFLTAGSIFSAKLFAEGYTENCEECKMVSRVVYYNSLDFCKKNVTTGLIDFSNSGQSFFNEQFLLLSVTLKIEQYTRDIQHFFETDAPCYIDSWEDDDELYVNAIGYIFIRETHNVKFIETEKGILLDFSFKDNYGDYGIQEGIDETLHYIGTLKNV